MTKPKTIAHAVAAVAAVAAALLCAATAAAAPVTLEFPTWVQLNGSQTAGYTLATTGTTFSASTVSCSPACPANGGMYVMSLNGTLTVARTDGSLFGLTSFDGGEAHMGSSFIWARDIRVVGQYADGSQVSSNFMLDGIQDASGPAQDFQTFLASSAYTGLRSLTFSGVGGQSNYYTLDNISLNDNGLRDGTVPEPGSLALVALALVGAASARSRLRKARG